MSIVNKMMPQSQTLDVNADGWRLLKQFDNHFWFCLGHGGPSGNGCDPGSSTTVISTTIVQPGTWYHVAGVRSASGIAIYVNGVLEDSKSFSPFTDSDSANVLIGSYEEAFFDGLIDEVDIYDRALSPTEIQVLFNAGSAGKCKATSGTFAPTGSLNMGRVYHTATLLPNGKVLVAGGLDLNNVPSTTAELYDPSNGSWTLTGYLQQGRAGHRATLLPNGQVLIAGGFVNTTATATATAELYDPSSGRWSLTSPLNEARFDHTATLLPNGEVLVAGGSFDLSRGLDATATAELYNPSSGTWAPTGSLQVARCRHTATQLNNGKVLVAGGCDIYGERTATAELYDPGSGSWTPTGPLNVAHAKHTATQLNNGKVLVAGGGEFPGTTSAELYDPSSGRWSLTGPLNVARFDHTATILPNGQELVTGGGDSSGPTASAELYDSSTDTWTLTGSMDKARSGHTATLLQNGQVLLAGGYDDPIVATAKAELFTRAGLYTFTGFFQPVDNLPILNVAKAGSAVPVKFSLHGNMGLAIMAAGSPASQPITCSATDPVDLIEQTVTASTSSLTYDPVADQYIYVWKTDKSWVGTCRQLVLTLRDGKPHYAHFTFTK